MLVSVLHTWETSPVSPREEAAAPAIAATGTIATTISSAVPMRRRTGAASTVRSIARVATKPASALHDDHREEHEAEVVAGRGARGQRALSWVIA